MLCRTQQCIADTIEAYQQTNIRPIPIEPFISLVARRHPPYATTPIVRSVAWVGVVWQHNSTLAEQ